jgi:lysozyme family protein
MGYAFSALAPEYINLLARFQLEMGKLAEFEKAARRIIALAKAHDDEWQEVHARTGVNIGWGICSFERESGSDYRTSPAQGDRWDRPSIHVPAHRGPFKSWGAACIDAYHIDHLEQVGAQNWTWARCCYDDEAFNGFGPRAHGRHSGYLWAGTNVYNGGKYVADGVWNPNAQDRQLGAIPLLYTVARLAPEYAPVDDLPGKQTAVFIPNPMPPPSGLHGEQHGIAWMQQKLGVPADGNFGRHTRRALIAFQKQHGLKADGLYGPKTEAAMEGMA